MKPAFEYDKETDTFKAIRYHNSKDEDTTKIVVQTIEKKTEPRTLEIHYEPQPIPQPEKTVFLVTKTDDANIDTAE